MPDTKDIQRAVIAKIFEALSELEDEDDKLEVWKWLHAMLTSWIISKAR